MELYNYFRSSASYRVRIALALKGLGYDYKSVHIAKNEQFTESYAAVSASRLVPLLRDGEHTLTQSLAIIEYLDETHPEPPLLPEAPHERARVRALALDIACEIHPLNNLRVLRYLVRDLKVADADKDRWYRHWVETGLEVVERQLAAQPARYCHGDAVLSQSLAIIEYLDETHPSPPLLPGDARQRAQIRALALDIACEIHPLNNLRVLRYLVNELKVSEDDKNRWYRHWVETGLEVVERQITKNGAGGPYCCGDTPTLADCALVPQIFNAQRLECRTDHVPTVMRAFESCMRLDAFSKTQPSMCPDAT